MTKQTNEVKEFFVIVINESDEVITSYPYRKRPHAERIWVTDLEEEEDENYFDTIEPSARFTSEFEAKKAAIVVFNLLDAENQQVFYILKVKS